MTKGFYLLSRTKFDRALELIDIADSKNVNKLLEKVPFTTVNPLTDTQKANAVLWEGNVIIEKPL